MSLASALEPLHTPSKSYISQVSRPVHQRKRLASPAQEMGMRTFEHPGTQVVEAISRQLATLNTNVRYLHEGLSSYAEALTATFPEPLSVSRPLSLAAICPLPSGLHPVSHACQTGAASQDVAENDAHWSCQVAASPCRCRRSVIIIRESDSTPSRSATGGLLCQLWVGGERPGAQDSALHSAR